MYTKMNIDMAKRKILQNKRCIILDVRTQEEYDEGHIPGSRLIPYEEVAGKACQIIENRNAEIYVYCLSGFRSRIACLTLLKLGYTNVFDIGGIRDWTGPVEKSTYCS